MDLSSEHATIAPVFPFFQTDVRSLKSHIVFYHCTVPSCMALYSSVVLQICRATSKFCSASLVFFFFSNHPANTTQPFSAPLDAKLFLL